MTSNISQVAVRLRRRPWLRALERDLDLTLLGLLHTDRSFGRWLLERVAPELLENSPEPEFIGAWHSVSTPNGESDIEAEWSIGDRRLVLLIEDKVRAEFQPDQGPRYGDRARTYVDASFADVTRTVVFTPARYKTSFPDELAAFEAHLSIEALAEWARGAGSEERLAYLARFFDHVASEQRIASRSARGPAGVTPTVVRGKAQYPEFYAGLPLLFAPRGLAITNSSFAEWVYFRIERSIPSTSLRWRLNDHWAELVFPKKAISREQVESMLMASPLEGAAVSDRGKTETVVWIPTAEVDPERSPDEQMDAVEPALDSVVRLRDWFAAAVAP